MIYSIEADQKGGTFSLPDLPYGKEDLSPYITAETLDYHHGKHHNAYVVNLNKFLDNNALAGKSLEEVILASAEKDDMAGIFNNAAQVWNHSFYWHSMKKNGGNKPEGELLDQINKDFGDFENFKTKFKEAGAAQFGSGWAWLVWNNSRLEIVKTPNAHTPITKGMIPLITCDVWEHAYYIDFRNKRPDYLDTFLEHLVNWEFAAKNFAKRG